MIYIICPVRLVDSKQQVEIATYVAKLRSEGNIVHYPLDSVSQSDPIGIKICEQHLQALKLSDEVHVFWDIESKGSHFDLGMAFALSKKIVPIKCFRQEGPEKSYWKTINALTDRETK